MLGAQLANEADISQAGTFITDPRFVGEQKLDGDRILFACEEDGRQRAYTRAGTEYTKRLPEALTKWRPPPGRWVFDGELVAGTYWLFDVPNTPLDNLHTRLTLHERRALLETLLGSIDHPFRLVPQARTFQEKMALAERAVAENFEGLVFKRIDAKYLPGRSDKWIKVKFVTTVDCEVTGVRDDGKESVALSIYDEHGRKREIGRASLLGKEKHYEINVGDVVEVRYLYVGANGRLYQPRIVRKRPDKRPDECLDAQLRHVNKRVLEAL